MAILEWVKQWFKAKKPVNKQAQAAARESNESTASSINTAPAGWPPFVATDTKPSVSTTRRPTTTIPATMLNTITLSSNQDRLFLIDDGKLITFSLYRGVSIGLLDGQLAVITPNKPQEGLKEEAFLESEGAAPPIAHMARGLGNKEILLPLGKNTQYNLTYNAANQAMGIIGATDIISTITVPDHPSDGPSGNCQLHLFDLSENILSLQRTKAGLLLTIKARK